jgi:hypothetical protein
LTTALAFLLTGGASLAGTNGAAPRNSQGIYYTFKDKNGGGVSVAWVDKSSGQIRSQQIVGQSKAFRHPHKLKVSESGRYLVATSTHSARHNLLVADLAEGTHRFLSVDRAPDDLAAWKDTFVIGAENQICYIVDAAEGKVVHQWNGRHELRPNGRRIEYVATTADGTAWTSWQKDSGGSGARKGSRVVTIDIPTGRTLADLQMPRALPQLHLADRKERGPSPEIIIPSTRTNTLLLSMDLYGGIAMADLDAAKEGKWRNLTYHSVSPDQSWGTAFPDRAAILTSGGKDFVFVANAGRQGGVSWIDLKERRIAQTLITPPGLTIPAVVAGGRYLASVAPGKTKSRIFGDLTESRSPVAELHVFEVRGLGGAQPKLSQRTHPLPAIAQHAVPVSPTSNDLVALATKDGILVVKASSGKVVDQQLALGRILRVALR